MKLIICGMLALAVVACCQGHALKKRSLDQLLGGGLGNLFGASSGRSSGGGFDIGSLLQAKLGAFGGGSSGGGQGGWSNGGGGNHHDSHDHHVDKVIYVKIIEDHSHGDHHDHGYNYNQGHGGWNSGW